MQWLRNVFARKATQPTKSTHRSFRPTLETLGARDLPSVSSVLTAGGLNTFIVDSSNSLLVGIDGGAPTLVIQGTATAGVRTAQGFRTPGGAIGADIVMLDGTWQHIETGGPGFLGQVLVGTLTASDLGQTGRILDVGTAYDSAGNGRLDVLIGTKDFNSTTNPSDLNQTGQLFEFDQAPTALLGPSVFGAITPLGSTVRFVSTYLTPSGGTGIAFGQDFTTPFDPTVPNSGFGRYFVQKFDTTLTTLYDGINFGTGAITEYSQTVAPSTGATTIPGNVLGLPVLNNNPRVVTDVTFDSDTSLSDFQNTTTTQLFNKTYALTFDTGVNTATGLAVSSFTFTTGTEQVKPGG